MAAADTRSLLELATQIHDDLGKLAVGLAHAGAPPQATQTLSAFATTIGKLANTLGAGPVGEAPPHPGAEPAPGPESAVPPAAGPPAQAGPPPGGPVAPQGMRPGERPSPLHEATVHLARAAATTAKASQQQ